MTGPTPGAGEDLRSRRGLPASVAAAVERALPKSRASQQVRLTQEGEMWLRPGARGLRFEAVESFAVERVGFAWEARFPLVGPLGLRVVDEYADGDGKLEVRLLGLPLKRERGAETVAGEALRYLAELPWVPHAMRSNRELEWRELDEGKVEVATLVAGRRLAVELELDAGGEIVGAVSTMRSRKVDGEWVSTPWGGSFGEYRALGGIRIPTVGEAYWLLPERSVYWRARVIAVDLLDEPLEGHS